MSLDIYLVAPQSTVKTCYHCDNEYTEHEEIFECNITHNLTRMANEAGIYQILWRPEELNIKTAGEIIKVLEKGITEMEQDPCRFKVHDAKNGWGTYEQFLPWLKRLLIECKDYPEALFESSR